MPSSESVYLNFQILFFLVLLAIRVMNIIFGLTCLLGCTVFIMEIPLGLKVVSIKGGLTSIDLEFRVGFKILFCWSSFFLPPHSLHAFSKVGSQFFSLLLG